MVKEERIEKEQKDKNAKKKIYMDISSDKLPRLHTWRKRKRKRETEHLLMEVQNNVMRTNYVKAKVDNTQQNSKCRSGGDSDLKFNHISEYSKLAHKEYKTRCV